jgi:hypothetical protein
MLKTRAQIEVSSQNKTGQLLVDTDTPINVVKDIIAKLMVFAQQIEDNIQEQAKNAPAPTAPAEPEATTASVSDAKPPQGD